MIRIVRDNDAAKILVSTDLPYDCKATQTVELHFIGQTTKPWLAQLTVRHLRSLLRERMKDIRQAEYERGWKDAKGKRRKETWFRGHMEI